METEMVSKNSRKSRLFRPSLLIGSAAVVIALGGFAATSVLGAGEKTEAKSSAYLGSATTSVKTALASQGQVSSNLSYSAEVRSSASLAVLPKATGRIEKLNVEVGSRVRAGDLIAQLDSAALETQVAQANANVAAAQAKYASLESGPRSEQVAQAKAGLDIAEARRDQVKKGATNSQAQAAVTAVDTARANLQIAQARLDIVRLGATQSQLAQATAAADSTRANMLAAQARLAEVKAGARTADLMAAQAAVSSAKSALDAARDRADYAKDNNDTARLGALGLSSASQAGEAVQAAQAAYDSALERLNQLKSGPLPADLQAAQSGYDAARAAFESATTALDQVKKGATREELQQAEAGVAAAQAQVASAEAALKQVTDGATDEELRTVEASVTQASQAYQLAQRPYTGSDLAMARASVLQAEAALKMAHLGLSEAQIVSPVDGVVSERQVSLGQLVGPSSPVVSIVSQEVELALGVEESQIGQVAEGQKVEVKVASYPDTLFSAKVAMIAPTADPKTRTFQVKLRPEGSVGKLRPGMFAQVKLVTQEKAIATLAPKESVVNRQGQTLVFVAKGDVVEARQVKVGLAGTGGLVEVIGLEPGEEVVVSGQNDLRDGDRVAKSA